MDDLSGSDRILLARDPFVSRQNSDIDFADVFGGPPRRSSLGEPRRSRTESLDSRSWRGSGGSGSGLGEKPVFGETSSSPARRRHLKDDFFSDIFRSSESSSCSSPLRRDFAPAPSPGSQMSSPTRSVVGGGSSLPAQISLSMKLAKDQPVFGSPTRHALHKSDDGSFDTSSYPSSPIFSTTVLTTRVLMAQDDLKIDGHGLYRQSPLSRPNSQSMDRSPEAIDSPSVSIRSQSQKDRTSLEKYISNGQFHFSIYEWAGKGVTLVMPSKSSNKHRSMSQRFPEIVVQEDELNLKKEDISASGSPSTIQSESQDTKLLKNLMKEDKDYAKSTLVDDLLPAEFESKFLPNDGTKILGNADVIRTTEGKEALSSGQRSVYGDTNIKAGKESKRKPVEVSSPSTSDPLVAQEEKMFRNKAKGKVKDFIKIFNQETLPKRKSTFETPGKRSRGKDEGKGKLEDQVNASAAKLDEQVEALFRNNDTSFSIPLEESEKANFFINSDVHMIDDLSERNNSTRPSSDLDPEILDDPEWNVEESHIEDLDGRSVEQIAKDQNKNMQTDSIQDQIKAMDAKIREWSKGKEGNIRSLLSTLQNVLWPESGWKQVPLVDLIEGAPVKRAYQKALLCLHPDKLQQRGASTPQKHTAEKVFDILQEAWIHFNSLSEL